jgi:HKD family nuclease
MMVLITYQWKKGNLVEYFKELRNVRSIRIATAYFSPFGLEVLRDVIKNNHLSKANVHLYLSTEFNQTEPVFLLKELNEIARVYIVDSLSLHAKAYLIENENGKFELIHGSSNLTEGGFQKNLEFMSYNTGETLNKDNILLFFKYCQNNARLVDQSIIHFYQEMEEELVKLNAVQNRIRKKFRTVVTHEDPFEKDDYDLSQSYFTYEDYETLFNRNAVLNGAEIKERRKEVQDKLIRLHKRLKKSLNGLDLHEHWKTKNITSSIDPNPFNHNKVSWIGVRYGKTEKEVKQLNEFLSTSRGSYSSSQDDYMGFQKHSCIQFSLVKNGYEIILFHAVASDAIDRGTFHDIIDTQNQAKLDKIVEEVALLKGKGFTWYITDAKNDKTIASFSFDEQEAKDFIEFYQKYDRTGYESFCSYYMPPNHRYLQDQTTLAKFTLQKIKQLLPLYQLISFRNTLKMVD